MEFLFTVGWSDTEMWAPLILRIGLGIALLTHGYPKLFKTFGQFSGYVASLKWPSPKLFALLAGVVEFFGALFLILGLFTKAAALVVAVYFLLVILTAHRGQKFQGGWELAFIYLVGMLTLWAIGDTGPWALQNIVFGK